MAGVIAVWVAVFALMAWAGVHWIPKVNAEKRQFEREHQAEYARLTQRGKGTPTKLAEHYMMNLFWIWLGLALLGVVGSALLYAAEMTSR